MRTTSMSRGSTGKSIVLGGLLCLALIVPSSPAADPKAGAQRLFPAGGLDAYLQFDGLDDHAVAWEATAARAILADTPAGAMLAEVSRQVADELLRKVPGRKPTGSGLVALGDRLIKGGFAVAIHSHPEAPGTRTVVLNGFGRDANRKTAENLLRLLIAPDGRRELPAPIRHRDRDVYEVRDTEREAMLANFEKEMAGIRKPIPMPIPAPPASLPPHPGPDPKLPPAIPANDPALAVPPAERPPAVAVPPAELLIPAAPAPTAVAAVPNQRPTGTPWLIWWFEGNDLILIFSPSPSYTEDLGRVTGGDAPRRSSSGREQMDAVLDAIEGKSPTVATHPGYAAALAEGRDLAGFEPDGLFFIEAGKDAGPLAMLTALGKEPASGLASVRRVVGRWGFQGKALMTDVRVEAPSPRTGALGCVDQPGFSKDRLPPIPRGVSWFTVGSFDPADTYPRLLDAMAVLAPELGKQVGGVEVLLRETTGLGLRQDVLRHLGPTWAAIHLTAPDRKPTDDDGENLSDYALLVGVDDADAFDRVLDTIAGRVNRYFRGTRPDDPPVLAIERLPAPERGYRLTSPAGLVGWLDDDRQPTIRIGKAFVALAMTPARAREALSAESKADIRWAPAGELVPAFAILPAGLTFLSVSEPRESYWPERIAHLPAYVQVFGNLAVDAINGADDDEELTLSGVLGIPNPDGFCVRIAPSAVPKAAAILPHLFPSTTAMIVDAAGIRILRREALPLTDLLDSVSITRKSSVVWKGREGPRLNRKIVAKVRFFLAL